MQDCVCVCGVEVLGEIHHSIIKVTALTKLGYFSKININNSSVGQNFKVAVNCTDLFESWDCDILIPLEIVPLQITQSNSK